MKKLLLATLLISSISYGLVVFGQEAEVSLTIEEKLVDKTAEEKASIKADEIVKQDFSEVIVKRDLQIEIQSVEKIEGGVQVFAKAYRNGQPIGFGADGSVEIERFIIQNPPVLVEDINGDITRSWIDKITGAETRTYREDPAEALKQALTRIIEVVGKDGSKIVAGKVGNTTTTVFAGTADALLYVVNAGTNQAAWDTAHDATSGTADIAEVSANIVAATDSVTFQRAITGFNTSAIGTDVISSATVSWYATASATITNTSATDLRILFATPASTTSYDGDDYEQIGAVDNPTVQATSKNLADIDSEGYKDFALNATGISNIDVDGTTVFGLRIGIDATDSYPGTSHNNTYQVYMADQTGTTNDPMIVVVHGEAAAEKRIINFD